MIVRVVIYEANSMDALAQWHQDRADQLKEVLGLKRIHFIRKDTKSLAGAIMYFESPEDLRVYKNSQRYEWLQESMQEAWAAEVKPVRDSVYRVLEVSETLPGPGRDEVTGNERQ